MKSINFLYDQNQHFLDKFVAWALTYGRTIVMLTELIALGAFLYRFGLDRQIVDFHDQITQEQTIVSASKNIEASFRNLQNRLAVAATLNSQASQEVRYILNTIDQAKGNVTFTSINEANNIVKVHIVTLDSTGLNAFVENLRGSPNVVNVSIDSLQTNGKNEQLEADMTITIHS